MCPALSLIFDGYESQGATNSLKQFQLLGSIPLNQHIILKKTFHQFKDICASEKYALLRVKFPWISANDNHSANDSSEGYLYIPNDTSRTNTTHDWGLTYTIGENIKKTFNLDIEGFNIDSAEPVSGNDGWDTLEMSHFNMDNRDFRYLIIYWEYESSYLIADGH